VLNLYFFYELLDMDHERRAAPEMEEILLEVKSTAAWDRSSLEAEGIDEGGGGKGEKRKEGEHDGISCSNRTYGAEYAEPSLAEEEGKEGADQKRVEAAVEYEAANTAATVSTSLPNTSFSASSSAPLFSSSCASHPSDVPFRRHPRQPPAAYRFVRAPVFVVMPTLWSQEGMQDTEAQEQEEEEQEEE